jgi:hypothetical protein
MYEIGAETDLWGLTARKSDHSAIFRGRGSYALHQVAGYAHVYSAGSLPSVAMANYVYTCTVLEYHGIRSPCHGPDLHMDEGHAPSPAIPGVIELARSQPPEISRLEYYIIIHVGTSSFYGFRRV